MTCSSASLLAGTVKTRDGSVINGKIVAIENGVILVETTYAGTIPIKQEEVVVFSSESTINVATQTGNTFLGTVEGTGDAIQISADGGTFETSVSNVSAAWQPGEDSPEERAYKEALKAKERTWAFLAAVDVSGKSGNSDRSSTRISGTATLEGEQDKLSFYTSIDKAEDNGDTTADEIKGGVDYSSNFGDTWSWYVRGELEQDEIELLDLRTTAAFGFGRALIKREDQELIVRGGLAYRFENFQDGSTVESPGLDLAVIHHKDFTWGILRNQLTYNPSFDDFANFRVYHESSLELPLGTGEFWKLGIGISNDYNSEPIDDLQAMDTTYFTRLILNWK